MSVPETPDKESLRLELQETLVTYRYWVATLMQIIGFSVAADVVLVSYGFTQRLAGILLVASTIPILILIMYMAIGTIASPLVGLALRIERRLLIRHDSLGAAYVTRYFKPMTTHPSVPIEDLDDEAVRHLNPKWNLRSPIHRMLFVVTLGQFGLFVLSLTVFHYRFM